MKNKRKNIVVYTIVLIFLSLFISDVGFCLDIEQQKSFKKGVKYVNTWIRMKEIVGISLYDLKPKTITAEEGSDYIIFFLSSWCDSCKKEIEGMKKIADTHAKLYTKVIYAFSHDAKEDAIEFAKKHDIEQDSILVDDRSIQTYNNPRLPTVFIVDRHGWIIDGYDALDIDILKDIDETMYMINSL